MALCTIHKNISMRNILATLLCWSEYLWDYRHNKLNEISTPQSWPWPSVIASHLFHTSRARGRRPCCLSRSALAWCRPCRPSHSAVSVTSQSTNISTEGSNCSGLNWAHSLSNAVWTSYSNIYMLFQNYSRTKYVIRNQLYKIKQIKHSFLSRSLVYLAISIISDVSTVFQQ